MQEEQFKQLIIKRLTEISLLKGIELKEAHYLTWANKISNDIKENLFSLDDIKKGFKNLESEKSYGGLDYAVFLDGAVTQKTEFQKEVEKLSAEDAWTEVLQSAKEGGNISISARSAKALKRLGGLRWLRESSPQNIVFDRKTFIDVYKNTPEPDHDETIKCDGLNAPVYFKLNENKQIGG